MVLQMHLVTFLLKARWKLIPHLSKVLSFSRKMANLAYSKKLTGLFETEIQAIVLLCVIPHLTAVSSHNKHARIRESRLSAVL